MKQYIYFGILLLGAAQPAAFGAPLVGSTFEDSELGVDGRTTVVTTNNSNLTPWYLATSSTSSRLEVVSDGDGKSMQLSRLEAGLTNFSGVSLLTGQSLKLTFDYHYAGDPVNGTEGLRVLLYSSGSATLPSSDANISSASVREEYTGYYLSIGSAMATNGTSQTFIRRRNADNANALNSSTSTSLIGTGSTAGVASGTSTHQVEITLSRVATDLSVEILVDGVSLISRTDASPFFDFNTLMISNNTSSTGGQIYLDNIEVAVVPEPGVATLLGGGILALAAFRSLGKLKK